MAPADDERLDAFVRRVLEVGSAHYRDLPWRKTRDPYAVLVSEVMLQQTQVSRVIPYWERWMERFPSLAVLDQAALSEVLAVWQGLGYNRRALALKRLASVLMADARQRGPDGVPALPCDEVKLRELPGVGPATAAGVMVFAFGQHTAYLETNVRAVFLHELFSGEHGVPDKTILPLVHAAAGRAAALGVDARTWNFALLDHGAALKRATTNPCRRSAHHSTQSPFEGSRRQLRARLLRAALELGPAPTAALAAGAGCEEEAAEPILTELAHEGFLAADEAGWWLVP